MEDKELWSAIAASNGYQLEDLLGVVDQLPLQDKAALVKHLMGGFGLHVTFGSPAAPSPIDQIHGMDKASLGDVLLAIADRISRE